MTLKHMSVPTTFPFLNHLKTPRRWVLKKNIQHRRASKVVHICYERLNNEI